MVAYAQVRDPALPRAGGWPGRSTGAGAGKVAAAVNDRLRFRVGRLGPAAQLRVAAELVGSNHPADQAAG